MDSRGAGRGKGNRGEGEEGGGGTRPEAVIDFERDDGGFPLEVARGLGRGGGMVVHGERMGFSFFLFFFPGEKKDEVGWDRRVEIGLSFFSLPFPFLSFFRSSWTRVTKFSGYLKRVL